MPDAPISGLNVAAALDGTEQLIADQAGQPEDVRVSVSAVKDFSNQPYPPVVVSAATATLGLGHLYRTVLFTVSCAVTVPATGTGTGQVPFPEGAWTILRNAAASVQVTVVAAAGVTLVGPRGLKTTANNGSAGELTQADATHLSTWFFEGDVTP